MPQTSLSIEEAIDKLIDASKVIQNRLNVKPAEDKRVNAALTLLAGRTDDDDVYVTFLRRVQQVMGLSIVVLCAAGLGPSKIRSLRDRVQVDLPHELKKREDELKSDVLKTLTDTYSAQCMHFTYLTNGVR